MYFIRVNVKLLYKLVLAVTLYNGNNSKVLVTPPLQPTTQLPFAGYFYQHIKDWTRIQYYIHCCRSQGKGNYNQNPINRRMDPASLPISLQKPTIHLRNQGCLQQHHQHTSTILLDILLPFQAIQSPRAPMSRGRIQDSLWSLCSLQFLWPLLHWPIQCQITCPTQSSSCCAAVYLWELLRWFTPSL